MVSAFLPPVYRLEPPLLTKRGAFFCQHQCLTGTLPCTMQPLISLEFTGALAKLCSAASDCCIATFGVSSLDSKHPLRTTRGCFFYAKVAAKRKHRPGGKPGRRLFRHGVRAIAVAKSPLCIVTKKTVSKRER